MTKRSALHERIANLTGQWIELFDYWIPAVVSDPLVEYDAIRRAAGLMDFSFLRMVDVDGPGAVDVVNSVVTRDIARLRPGGIAYSALCSQDGTMLDDCTAMVRDDEHVRVCGANDQLATILAEAGAGTGVDVREFTEDMPHLCVQGPRSREILAPLADGDISPGGFRYYTFREDLTIGGIPVFMTRMGYTAELGFELWTNRDYAADLWDLLVRVGDPMGMKVVGAASLTIVRTEGGLILKDVEYDATVSPYECGMGWSVALDKGPLRGRAALQRDRDATRRRIASVVLDSGGDQASGASLFSGDLEVGRITEAVTSPHLAGRTLGLAEIDRDYRAPGTALHSVLDGTPVAAITVPHPVYDPNRARAKLS